MEDENPIVEISCSPAMDIKTGPLFPIALTQEQSDPLNAACESGIHHQQSRRPPRICYGRITICSQDTGGWGGIRTPDTFRYTRFPGVRNRPLCHPSMSGRKLITENGEIDNRRVYFFRD